MEEQARYENVPVEQGEGNPALMKTLNPAGKLESVEVWLTEPIVAYGKPVERLTIRAPKGKDRIAIGNPYILFEGGVDIVQERIFKYAAQLSNTPRPLFDAMDMEDLDNLQEAVLLFFGDKKLARMPTGNPASTT